MNEIEKLKKEMIKIGRLIFQSGLTDSHGGNISVRYNDYILIKKSGKMLGTLTEEDIVVTTVEENPELDKTASIELKVHRNIYKKLPEVKAVVHAHSPYTVAVSLTTNEIIPLDSEVKFLLGTVPVLSAKQVISSNEVAEKLPELLKKCKIAVVKSHGPFSTGKTLEEAYKYLSAVENSCKIISIVKGMER
ncbi:aldolase [Desulfurobacterium atlanticum]|uniref:L-fuculose-phosphate aldolase n=1 Tax=Desulfurobacterium atlanticum TaxID=240169 RepID=A0A238ZUA4_9BACT|nr:aldolase [Desulfurobacterium atlanticum]SNR86809.1 L-fuculose-phosphate aldolase [Desulfurobacterium atlanticum]